MNIYREKIQIATKGQRTYEITDQLNSFCSRYPISTGLLNIHCLHTSCSLVLMENADPSARRDLENWLNRLVPEKDPHFTHTYEGPDDMPSHIKMALTRSNETLPIENDSLLLGTWQGVFLWEHRTHPHHRSLILTLIAD